MSAPEKMVGPWPERAWSWTIRIMTAVVLLIGFVAGWYLRGAWPS